MRERGRTPAGGVQAEKQQRYVQLVAQGVNNSEACDLDAREANGPFDARTIGAVIQPYFAFNAPETPRKVWLPPPSAPAPGRRSATCSDTRGRVGARGWRRRATP